MLHAEGWLKYVPSSQSRNNPLLVVTCRDEPSHDNAQYIAGKGKIRDYLRVLSRLDLWFRYDRVVIITAFRHSPAHSSDQHVKCSVMAEDTTQ